MQPGLCAVLLPSTTSLTATLLALPCLLLQFRMGAADPVSSASAALCLYEYQNKPNPSRKCLISSTHRAVAASEMKR